jgi:hypothetical protein
MDRVSTKSVSLAQRRKARALRKLGISADQLAKAQQITPFLKEIRGGLKAVLGAMRFSQDPVVQYFIAKRDSLGVWARENICWEAISLAAGIHPAQPARSRAAGLAGMHNDGREVDRHLALSGTDEKANRVRQTPRRMARSRCHR